MLDARQRRYQFIPLFPQRSDLRDKRGVGVGCLFRCPPASRVCLLHVCVLVRRLHLVVFRRCCRFYRQRNFTLCRYSVQMEFETDFVMG
jgi:hypothetical protein